MLIFSRRRIDVSNFGFQKLNDNEGRFFIDFNSDSWQAENLLKQINKQIDVFDAKLIKQ